MTSELKRRTTGFDWISQGTLRERKKIFEIGGRDKDVHVKTEHESCFPLHDGNGPNARYTTTEPNNRYPTRPNTTPV
jgi:hypothetical protein